MTPVFFLPGAGASAGFWRPVADLLHARQRKHFFAWPGLGNEPGDPAVRGLGDLVSLVLSRLAEPTDLITQSMGGLVAMKVALAAPEKVRRLVLTATSAGVPVSDLGGSNWRPDYRRNFPAAASWITEVNEDLSTRLPTVTAPCLLLWGGADTISPPAVGHRLLELLPNARLHIVPGADHDVARTHASELAPMIEDHLR